MEIYFAVCAGIATFCLIVCTAVLIATLLELQKAAQAVTRLTENVNDRFSRICAVADQVSNFVSSGWVRGAQSAFNIFSGLRGRFSRGREEAEAASR